ncbi:hypothetical protein GOP47_0012505 [Adiantum capillus-veneris]|uniref:Cytochrome P450 n=1 Tax=Adiantum capillus-veneris TaxID=13818 RepID=A0A9D4ZEH5_ADICA|nr:hypothetical protein GOP47_0012505 [Adiantum capillus-veneris]
MMVAMMMVVAAAAVGWGWWLSFWKPSQLLYACTRQGICGFTLSPLQSVDCAEGRSWILLNSIQRHGKMFYVKLGKVVSLVVLDPLSVQQLLTQNADCYAKGLFVRALGILGNGVFSSSGSEWMDQRQLLGHCFFMRELKDHFETIQEAAKNHVECWSALATEVVDVHKLFLELTVGLICEIAIGESIEKKIAIMIFERFNSYLNKYRQRVCSPFYSFFGYRWKSQYIMEDEKHLLTTIKELVCKREQTLNSRSSKEGLAIDLLIERAQGKENSNPSLVIDNTSTLILAGHETTANLLTWTVYLLGTHLNWQEEARSEAQGIIELDMKNMSQLKILGMILWESLRLYPPQPIIARRCMRENTVSDIIIPKGLEVIIPVSAMHRNKDVWGQDSEEFKPGRFANGINKACKVPSSFLPFGSGPRTCIGQTLALLEAKVTLYHMLKNYSWEISPGYQHCPDVTLTLQPLFGMPIILVRQ